MSARDQKLSSTSSDMQELTTGMRTIGLAISAQSGFESIGERKKNNQQIGGKKSCSTSH